MIVLIYKMATFMFTKATTILILQIRLVTKASYN